MTITSCTIDDLYIRLAGLLLEKGSLIRTRGLLTKELTNVQLILNNPTNRFIDNTARLMDMRYFVGELCYFLDQRTDLASIVHYSKFWNKVSDDGYTVNSAYGFRLFNKPSQLEYVIKTLANDTYSRKAVMTIYDKQDSKESNDNPCTMNIQFLIRNNNLLCFVNMRSNDIWLGLPYDVAFFTIVHEIVWLKLKCYMPNLCIGPYHHNVTSMHVYDHNFAALTNVANTLSSIIPLVAPPINLTDISYWFNDLIDYEKAYRKTLTYKTGWHITPFQTWCKQFLV